MTEQSFADIPLSFSLSVSWRCTPRPADRAQNWTFRARLPIADDPSRPEECR
jgi:hypothetical protein